MATLQTLQEALQARMAVLWCKVPPTPKRSEKRFICPYTGCAIDLSFVRMGKAINPHRGAMGSAHSRQSRQGEHLHRRDFANFKLAALTTYEAQRTTKRKEIIDKSPSLTIPMKEPKKKTTSPSGDNSTSVGSDIAAGLRHLERMRSLTMEELAKRRAERDKNKNEEITKPSVAPTYRSYDDIIDNGTIYQKAALYINNFDGGIPYGSGSLTDEQVERVRQQIYNTTEENKMEGVFYIKVFNSLLLYGRLVNIYKTTYQREAAKLTGLINLWEAAHNTYNTLSNLLKAANINGEAAEGLVDMCNSGSNEGYEFRIEDVKLILDDIELWDKIKRQAEKTAEALSELKGFIEPLSDYLNSEGEPTLWAILPHRLERWMDYPDEIEEQKQPDKAKYFRYILRKRKESGETITPEEERLAVYPDYNEVTIDAATEKYAKEQLNDCLFLWEAPKRKKTPKRGRPKKDS